MRLAKHLLVFLVCIIVFSTIGYAQPNSFNDVRYLVLNLRISSSIDLIQIGPNPFTEYIIADLFFHPITGDGLELISMETAPKSKIVDSRIRYTWLAPSEKSLAYSLSSKLRSNYIRSNISGKVVYPLGFIPPEASAFLKETATVDFSNPNVRVKASELARGQDDLFVLVSNIASYAKENIDYNLSSVTAKASKPASWVLENKYGVCDEITNLFIALLRSQKIPAKYISGISYSSSKDAPQVWGAHGWAEVYFPGFGWVPFDPTYSQFGWLDPTHIKLKEGLDATEPSTSYEWRADNIKMGIHPIRLESDVIQSGPRISPSINLSIEPARYSVSIGSYNVIFAKVKNTAPAYVSSEVTIAPTEGITLIGSPKKLAILRPLEISSLAWIVQVSPKLTNNFIYTFPIVAFSSHGVNATSSFNSSEDDPYLGKQDAIAISQGQSIKAEKMPSLDCTSKTTMPKKGEQFQILCKVQNQIPDSNAVICAEGICILADINQSEYIITVAKNVPGRQETLVTLNTQNSTSYSSVKLTVLDSPRLIISSVSAPEFVNYDEKFNLTVNISKLSLASPSVATLTIRLIGSSNSWPVHDSRENSFNIAINGADIAGAGGVEVVLMYTDENGSAREEKSYVKISIRDLDAWQSVRMLFNRIALWIHDNLSPAHIRLYNDIG